MKALPNITTFANPWPLEGEYDKNIHGRVSADMPLDVKHEITSLRPTLGTPQIVINILWTKLIQALHESDITNFTQQSEFCDFVANCRIVDGRNGTAQPSRSTAAGAVRETTPPHVNGREAGVASQNPQSPNQSRDNAGANVAGSGATSRGGKAKVGKKTGTGKSLECDRT